MSRGGPARMRQTENAGQCPIDAADGEKTQDYSAYVLCSCYSGISRPRPLTLLLSTPTALGPVATRPFGPLRSMCPPNMRTPWSRHHRSFYPLASTLSPLLTILILVSRVLALFLTVFWFILSFVLVSPLSCPSLVLFNCQVGTSAWDELA